jgi:hypothetical protein
MTDTISCSQDSASFFDYAAIRDHCHLLHYLASRANIPGKLILAAFGGGYPKVQAFEIGQIEEMTEAAMAFQGTQYNLYAPWCLMHPDLPDGSKGGEKDVVATLAFPVDADADSEGPTPHAPFKNLVIESSAGNYQEIMILETALPPIEAEPLARALGELTGDKMCVGDISRIMRIPGTFNWPNKAKLKRGRSPDPQPVRVHTAWDRTFTSIEALRASVANVKPKSTTKTITAPVPDAVNGISHDGFRIDEVRWYCQRMAKVWTADERETNPDDFELGKRIKHSFPGQDGLDAFLLLEWGDREHEMKKRWWGKNDFKTEGANLLTLRGLKETNWIFRHVIGCPCPPAPPLAPLPVGAPLPEGWHWTADGKCARLPAEGLPVPLRTDLRAAIDDLNSKYAFTLLKGSPVVIKEGGKAGLNY